MRELIVALIFFALGGAVGLYFEKTRAMFDDHEQHLKFHDQVIQRLSAPGIPRMLP